VSVRRQPDKNAVSEVANKWDDYADPSISGALRKSLNFPRARQRIVFKLQLGLEPVSFCCTHIPNTPTLAIRLLRLYTLIREHLAFAAESLPSFSLHHHKDGPRPRRLLLYHHHHHHQHHWVEVLSNNRYKNTRPMMMLMTMKTMNHATQVKTTIST
jgi:hypothetical protein